MQLSTFLDQGSHTRATHISHTTWTILASIIQSVLARVAVLAAGPLLVAQLATFARFARGLALRNVVFAAGAQNAASRPRGFKPAVLEVLVREVVPYPNEQKEEEEEEERTILS